MTTLYDAWKIQPSSKYLDGEDIDLYENYQLAPDVRPIYIHGKGITKDNMPYEDYRRLKRFSSEREGGRCKCCKRILPNFASGDWWKVDEIIDYDIDKKIAVVKSIITLCKTCWLSRHLGAARCHKLYETAIDNLKKVRDFNDEQLKDALSNHRWGNDPVNIYDEEWTIDTSLLTNNGFTLYRST